MAHDRPCEHCHPTAQPGCALQTLVASVTLQAANAGSPWYMLHIHLQTEVKPSVTVLMTMMTVLPLQWSWAQQPQRATPLYLPMLWSPTAAMRMIGTMQLTLQSVSPPRMVPNQSLNH